MSTSLRWRDMTLGGIGTVAVLVLWEAAARWGSASPLVFPPPSSAVIGALHRMPLDVLSGYVAISLERIVLGFFAGAVLGVVLAVAGGWYRNFGNVLRPMVELLRPIPPLAWIPMAIVWFGLGESSKVFVIFLAAFFPVFTNAWKGMTGIDPVLLRAGQTMDLTGPALLFRVALPAAMPDIATGLRIGWGLSFGVLVAAELIAADSGLGYMIMKARQLADVDTIIFGILLIGVVNLITDWGIASLIRRQLGNWHPT
jgi:ABC-type nitrate/sulfonate/bicarbonate transport system permease component